MCAELAHDHALEDLHKITEHTSDPSDPVRGMREKTCSLIVRWLTRSIDKDPFFTVNYTDHATQSEPRKPDE